jgi:chemotaxis protein CheX
MRLAAVREEEPDGGIWTVDTREKREDRWTCQIVDDAVAEVFASMLQLPYAVVDEAPATGATISARIAFSGAIDGECVIQLPVRAAERLTDTLLEAEGDWDDEMIDDAVGELCNMIAGGWKSRSGMDAKCQMSVPAVSRHNVRERVDENRDAMRRFYGLGEDVLEVAMTLRKAGTGGCVDCHPVPFPSRLIA